MAVQALIAVSPKAFVFLWWIALLFHAVCIMYASGVVSVHRYIIAQNLQVIVDYLGHNAIGFLQPVIAVMYVVIPCHTAAILRAVVYSLHAREFRFTKRPLSSTTVPCHPNKVSDTRGPTVAAILPAVAPSATCFDQLRCHYSNISTHLNAYSITGPKYDVGFFVFEASELSLQTYQAHKLSSLVSAVWINRLYAVVLISNCWSTAIVHKFLHTKQLAKRVLLVAVDMLFDMITNLIIPFVVFVPHYWEFDTEPRDFPMDNYYHDVWLIRAISENQQVFVTSWLDLSPR
jgi:hypothetical protein